MGQVKIILDRTSVPTATIATTGNVGLGFRALSPADRSNVLLIIARWECPKCGSISQDVLACVAQGRTLGGVEITVDSEGACRYLFAKAVWWI